MKKIKQILLILVTIMCIFNFMPYIAHADDGYYIKHMDVQVKANDKREFKIRETLKVYFNEEKHGIIRKIPKEGFLENYKITDVSVEGDPFEENDEENLELKIGDKYKTIKGDKTYVINYTLKFYDDKQEDGDYIYLNVLGTEWDTYIESFTSTITYPKNATLQKITITDGEYGSKISNYVNYTTNKNQINIKSKSVIPSYCGVTVNAKLNQGAFKNAPIKIYPFIYYISMIVSLIILVLLIFIYIKDKDKEPFISVVEFYPPKDLNSADVAYAYNQVVSNRDVVSLLYYWASDNHIKITINNDNSFKLEKTNELDDKHKEYEKTLFEDIFSTGDGKCVTDKDFKDVTIKSINSSKTHIENYFKNERELVDRSSVKKARLIGLLPSISILLAFIYSGIFSYNLKSSLKASGILIVLLLIYNTLLISSSKTNSKDRYISKYKILLIIGKIFLLAFYICISFFVLNYINLFDFIVLKSRELPASLITLTFLVSIIGVLLSSLMIKRSSYGKDILAQIEGFRDFMEVAEKERLEALLEDDPYYFYNTLPYAQVLCVTKKWIDKFDGILMKQPDYYDTYYPINKLDISLNNITSTVSQSAQSPSSSSSSGGFSSGGSSGGGGGGGGGSSW